MKQYSHNGNAYLVHEGELYVRCSEDTPTESQPQTAKDKFLRRITRKKTGTGELCHCGRPLGHTGIHTGSKLGKKAVGGCSICHKKGHNVKTCPERSEARALDVPETKGGPCLSCDAEDHATKDCPDLGKTIQKMKHAGRDSLQIAAELHINLGTINKFWATGEPEGRVHNET